MFCEFLHQKDIPKLYFLRKKIIHVFYRYILSSFYKIFFQIYHYCHADGKQDTFHCSYGTIFNEYLGTCDHASAVLCKGGEGYAGPPHTPHHAPHHAPHHVTHDHHAPHHVTHHAPSPHHVSHHSPHHDVTPAHHGFSGPNFNFPAGFGSGF